MVCTIIVQCFGYCCVVMVCRKKNIRSKRTLTSLAHWNSGKVSACMQGGWTLFSLFARLRSASGSPLSNCACRIHPSLPVSLSLSLSLSHRRCFNFTKATTFHSQGKRFIGKGDLVGGEGDNETVTAAFCRAETCSARND